MKSACQRVWKNNGKILRRSAYFLCGSSNYTYWGYEKFSESCTGFPDFVGDGFCDDQNNNPFCFFDVRCR